MRPSARRHTSGQLRMDLAAVRSVLSGSSRRILQCAMCSVCSERRHSARPAQNVVSACKKPKDVKRTRTRAHREQRAWLASPPRQSAYLVVDDERPGLSGAGGGGAGRVFPFGTQVQLAERSQPA